MRIPSGKTDQVIYFVALDLVDRSTRKTGLTTFTVYRSRNGGTATVYTTPTVAELSSANMPGVYALTVDEDTTIASGSDSEEYCVHITQANMLPVTRTIELYRRDTTSGNTAAVDSGGGVTLTNAQDIKKNTALANFMFVMYDTSGTPKTGLQASLRTAGNSQRRIDGGAFADLANIATITEISNGWYTLDFAAADLNGTNIAVRLSATGAKDLDFLIHTVSP